MTLLSIVPFWVKEEGNTSRGAFRVDVATPHNVDMLKDAIKAKIGYSFPAPDLVVKKSIGEIVTEMSTSLSVLGCGGDEAHPILYSVPQQGKICRNLFNSRLASFLLLTVPFPLQLICNVSFSIRMI